MLLFILRRILLIHAVIVTLTIITVKVGVFTVTRQSPTTDSLSASSPTDSLYVNANMYIPITITTVSQTNLNTRVAVGF